VTARICFKPKGCAVAVPFQRLGSTKDGEWGVVEDDRWIVGPQGAELELLYPNEADYRHAMRRLSPKQVARAIEFRRHYFGDEVWSRGLSEIQPALQRCIARTDDDPRGLRLRAGLLALHADSINGDRYREDTFEFIATDLMKQDDELIHDLHCPALRQKPAVDPDGKERAFRQGLREEMRELRAKWIEHTGGLVESPVDHGYLVKPVTSFLRRKIDHERKTFLRWRDGMIMGLADRDVEKLRGSYQMQILYARGSYAWLAEEMTDVQFDVDVEDRLAHPSFDQHLDECRIFTASCRQAALLELMNRDKPDLAHERRVLGKQLEAELRGLGAFCTKPPPRPSLDELLADLLGLIDVVTAIALRTEGLQGADSYRPLSAALRKLIEEDAR
jgi:hypothetical protein